MHIDRNLFPYVVHSDDSIAHALRKISSNRAQVVYCISGNGVLEGVVTDGDFRRWVVNEATIDLEQPVATVANTAFVWAGVDEAHARLERRFSERIKSVPLVDERQRIAAIAWPRPREFTVAGRCIGEREPAFVIAEIGNNHNGSLDLAKQLVDAAAAAGAECVKFQLRDLATMYIDDDAARRQGRDLGDEYTLDLLRRFQLTDDELFDALDYTRARGLVPLCSPWDLVSLRKLERYGLPALKLASADLTNHELLAAAARTGIPLFVSTGMSDEHEIASAVELLRGHGAPFILLHCNSTYPTPPKDVRLRYMDRLRDLGGVPVGYSGHERGYNVAVAAVARGACVVEKHLTLDRTLEGNDHRVSLLPDEFGDMVAAIRDVEPALGDVDRRSLTQGERLNREVLAKSLVAARAIELGATIGEDDLAVRSPGRGISPARRAELVGRIATRDFEPGDFFYPSDVEGQSHTNRQYKFQRPWGIPVRYHDYEQLAGTSNPELLEFHLSYRDLDIRPHDAVPAAVAMGLVVHAPELFAGDHVLDLATLDDKYRTRSLAELRRVVQLTVALRDRFQTARPGIVVNVGGFSFDRHTPAADRRVAYDRVAEALDEVAHPDVELWPQTMPPFPWHFGGQRFHNLFVTPPEVVQFCERTGQRICLDLSHTALAANHLGMSLIEAVAALAPHTAHLHLADAQGADGEGLQIGEGSIDFGAVAHALRDAPGASFIPEIWQGHKNGGDGFWTALERLERWF